jgi:uncharacterized protein (UPF0264 family)
LKLLVSVVDWREASEAVEGGANIVDVKNPIEGPLGANFPWVIKEIRRNVSREVELSATIGDMPNLPGTAALAALGAAVSGADYVKVGLLGPKTSQEAVHLMKAIRRAVKELNQRTRVIAAAYADYRDIESLNPTDLPKVASDAGADGILVDIFGKCDRKLFEYIEEREVGFLIKRAHEFGVTVALAGLLGIEDIRRSYRLGADIFGVRKSACEGGDRLHGRVSKQRVARLSEAIRSLPNYSGVVEMPSQPFAGREILTV